ncbi:MAG: hypothetical protein COY40_00960 [Alphaproteobacteria bacterium CG_4_10_14_0_8_um_filter_53_9]|nr:MAG: hypothetical protein COY40_00960 [Alphaproteobacteria bacterium CG_4_10_14_0_8_um_filter_53_9]
MFYNFFSFDSVFWLSSPVYLLRPPRYTRGICKLKLKRPQDPSPACHVSTCDAVGAPAQGPPPLRGLSSFLQL